MINDYIFNKENEDQVRVICDELIYKFIRQGYNIVLDETNLSDKNYDDICAIAKNIGDVKVIEKYFPIDVEEAVKRNENRLGHAKIPEDVIFRFNAQIKHEINKYGQVREREVYFPSNVVAQDITLPEAIIVDLDGTLANHKGVRYIHDLTLCDGDKCYLHIRDILNWFRISKANTGKIIICSGREDKYKDLTQQWLKKYCIEHDELFMRKAGDRRKDCIIKREIFDANIKGKYNILFSLDDRNQVVEMYRHMGIPCLQCNYGDF